MDRKEAAMVYFKIQVQHFVEETHANLHFNTTTIWIFCPYQSTKGTANKREHVAC
jgi:hypothetical protein